MAKEKEEVKKNEPEEIDFSAIKNLNAVAAVDEEGARNISKQAKKTKKTGMFNFLEEELIALPSGGRYYKEVTDDEDILSGFIKMRPMTVKEEQILSTRKYLREGIATRMILENCITSDIDAKDILLFDSNFLMFYLRKISYGDEYKFEIKSTEDLYGRKFKHTLKISELAFEELPKELKEPIVIKLPRSKYTVECVLARLYHSESIHKMEMKKDDTDENSRVLDNALVTTVRIIDDSKKEVPEKHWREFYEALLGEDIATIREATVFDTGIDNIKVICPYTGNEMEAGISLGPEFFRL